MCTLVLWCKAILYIWNKQQQVGKTGDISSVFTRASWWFSCAQKMEEVVEWVYTLLSVWHGRDFYCSSFCILLDRVYSHPQITAECSTRHHIAYTHTHSLSDAYVKKINWALSDVVHTDSVLQFGVNAVWVAAFSLMMFAALLFKLMPSSHSCDLHLSASGSWVNLLVVLLYAELSQSTSLRITLLSMWWCEGKKINWTEEKKFFFFDLFSCPCMTSSRDPCMQSQMKNPLRRSIFLPKSLLLYCTRKGREHRDEQ